MLLSASARVCGKRQKKYSHSGRTLFEARSTWNSVEPNPMPFFRPRAMAHFPFSIHGVIFATKTSFSEKTLYPFESSLKGRVNSLLMSPATPLTTSIGIKEHSALLGSLTVTGGFICAISAIDTRSFIGVQFVCYR